MTGATREALIKIHGTLLREGWDDLAEDAAAPTTEEGRTSSTLEATLEAVLDHQQKLEATLGRQEEALASLRAMLEAMPTAAAAPTTEEGRTRSLFEATLEACRPLTPEESPILYWSQVDWSQVGQAIARSSRTTVQRGPGQSRLVKKWAQVFVGPEVEELKVKKWLEGLEVFGREGEELKQQIRQWLEQLLLYRLYRAREQEFREGPSTRELEQKKNTPDDIEGRG